MIVKLCCLLLPALILVSAQDTAPDGFQLWTGDSLTHVVRNFADRARLFDQRQLVCAGLARGLELVESQWSAYTAARRGAGVLDGGRAGRDQALYAGVDSVERKFDQSGCARP
jgi:hypothetical protein